MTTDFETITRRRPTRSTPSKRPSKPRVAVRINRNLANYPLARDARSRVVWTIDGGNRWATLPGEDRIVLAFPAKARPRLPDGFDVNVLLRLIAEVQRTRKHTVSFRSFAGFLADIGVQPRDRSRKALMESFELWRRVGLAFATWHPEGAMDLPPPIKSIKLDGYGFTIRMAERWTALDRGYFLVLPLPLPAVAVVQNLVLMSATMAGRSNGGDGIVVSRLRTARSLARKAGLSSNHRRKRLRPLLRQAELWYAAAGGVMVAKLGGRPQDRVRDVFGDFIDDDDGMTGVPRMMLQFSVRLPRYPWKPLPVPPEWERDRAEYDTAARVAVLKRRRRKSGP